MCLLRCVVYTYWRPCVFLFFFFFFFNDTATTEIYTLSLHDALPSSRRSADSRALARPRRARLRRGRLDRGHERRLLPRLVGLADARLPAPRGRRGGSRRAPRLPAARRRSACGTGRVHRVDGPVRALGSVGRPRRGGSTA